jgi:hypothetical protein
MPACTERARFVAAEETARERKASALPGSSAASATCDWTWSVSAPVVLVHGRHDELCGTTAAESTMRKIVPCVLDRLDGGIIKAVDICIAESCEDIKQDSVEVGVLCLEDRLPHGLDRYHAFGTGEYLSKALFGELSMGLDRAPVGGVVFHGVSMCWSFCEPRQE